MKKTILFFLLLFGFKHANGSTKSKAKSAGVILSQPMGQRASKEQEFLKKLYDLQKNKKINTIYDGLFAKTDLPEIPKQTVAELTERLEKAKTANPKNTKTFDSRFAEIFSNFDTQQAYATSEGNKLYAQEELLLNEIKIAGPQEPFQLANLGANTINKASKIYKRDAQQKLKLQAQIIAELEEIYTTKEIVEFITTGNLTEIPALPTADPCQQELIIAQRKHTALKKELAIELDTNKLLLQQEKELTQASEKAKETFNTLIKTINIEKL